MVISNINDYTNKEHIVDVDDNKIDQTYDHQIIMEQEFEVRLIRLMATLIKLCLELLNIIKILKNK